LRLLLCSDEQDSATVCDKVADEGISNLNTLKRLVKVDDVDSVALSKNELLHLRIPTTGLVTKVHTSFEHLTH
jgi:hypothetical protein